MVNIEKHNYESYVKTGIITQLSKVEKRKYENYHKANFEEDQKICFQLTKQSPKWSIIAGYYAMHNITKLFLTGFDIKISDKSSHTATFLALKKVIQDDKIKSKAIDLLKKAQETYEILNSPFKEKILAHILSKSMEERKKAQYYSEDTKQIQIINAMSFQEDILKPYTKIIEGLIKDAN